MAKMFDLESLVCGLCSFAYENGSLKIQLEEREMWELRGNFEFSVFFKHVCQLPYVRELVTQSATLNLLPHCSNLVYRNLKNTLRAMVWQGLGHCADQMFLDENNDAVAEFNNSQLSDFSLKSCFRGC
jgi:hypothetical protein